MSIKIDGLGKLQISLKNRTEAVVNEISAVMEQNIEKIKEKITRDTPQGSEGNKLRNSTFSEKDGDFKFSVFNPTFYGPMQEFGTKRRFNANGRQNIAAEFKGRGAGGDFENMVKDIAKWLDKKGYYPPEIRGVKAKMNYARFTAMKIARNGVAPANKGTGFFYKHYDQQLPIILRSLQMSIKKFNQ
jgi:hypothetical protein